MTPEERQLLTSLFERVGATGAQPRDREAEALIAEALRRYPFAPYVLAQTVLVQDEALRAAAERINSLEAGAGAEEAPSFLGRSPSRTPSGLPGMGVSQAPNPPAGPWGAPAQQPQPGSLFGGAPGGGGFLRNAMSTAAGVAGGALLFQGIQNLFSGKEGGTSGLLGPNEANAGTDSSFADQFIGKSGHEAEPAPEGPDLTEAGYDPADDQGDDGFDLGMDDDGDWA